MFNAVFRLRKDNDYNYAKIKDTFIPQDGEICLVQTARNGLRAVCGDGKTTFGQLEYMNDFIIKGYFDNGRFYEDSQKTIEIQGSDIKLYVDTNKNSLYYFNGEEFVVIGANGEIPTASAKVAGVMKLYNTIGANEDGTMTQKAITDELEEKVEVEVIHSEELLIFT